MDALYYHKSDQSRVFIWIKITLALILTFVSPVYTQPLFSLHEYDKRECDSSVVSHTITHDNYAAVASNLRAPLLKFNPTFVFNNLNPEDILHYNSIVVVDPHYCVHANPELQMKLLSFLQDGHIVTIQTDALARSDGDSGPEQELLRDVAAFETLSGVILPFYISTIEMTNVTVPMFRLEIPSLDPLSSASAVVLEDDAALEFLKNGTRHHRVMSILDLLDQQQLVCLLSRLQCHRVAPTDLTFQLCAQSARRLSARTRKLPSLLRLRPLLSYISDDSYGEKRGASLETMKLSFENVTSQVRTAYKLMVDGASETRIRMALIYPGRQTNEESIRLQYFVYLPPLLIHTLPFINYFVTIICVLVAVFELVARFKLLPQVKRLLKHIFTVPWTHPNLSNLAVDRAKIF